MGFLNETPNAGLLLRPVASHGDVLAPETAGDLVAYTLEGEPGSLYAKDSDDVVYKLSGGGATLIFAQTADQTWASAIGSGNLWGTGVGSDIILANRLKPGTVIRVEMSGKLSTATSPGGIESYIELAGQQVLAAIFTPAGSLTNVPFTFSARLTCRTDGATGTFDGGGAFEYQAGSLAVDRTIMVNTEKTVDTTVDNSKPTVSWAWAAFASGDTVTSIEGSVEVLQPDQ